jgi:L-cystine uptake protein TcyP (sodium:dicarboxylate symporter family)
MLKKYSVVIALFLLIAIIISSWQSPALAGILSVVLFLFILGIAILSIFEKHKQAENPRPRIAKDILILVFTLLLIIFLGGLMGLFANYYASLRFGTIAGFVSAIAASFVVGYFVWWGVGKLDRQ